MFPHFGVIMDLDFQLPLFLNLDARAGLLEETVKKVQAEKLVWAIKDF
jgi:hypothetical protein